MDSLTSLTHSLTSLTHFFFTIKESFKGKFPVIYPNKPIFEGNSLKFDFSQFRSKKMKSPSILKRNPFLNYKRNPLSNTARARQARV